jgi:hypothetical protein
VIGLVKVRLLGHGAGYAGSLAGISWGGVKDRPKGSDGQDM